MGITPSAPLWIHRVGRPDVAHVFGFRDPPTRYSPNGLKGFALVEKSTPFVSR
jgi:hypothetical protein